MTNKIEFPENTGANDHGVRWKSNWLGKQMDGNDDPARFFVRHAKVVKLDGTDNAILD